MDYQIIYQLTEAQIETLHHMYQQEWWSKNRQLEDVKKMLSHSDIIVGISGTSNELLGFARVLTDYVYRAVILDIIVVQTKRRQGLGKLLLENIINHSDLKNVEYFFLFCLPEMVSFYEQFNFESRNSKVQLMRLCNTNKML